MTTVSDGLYQWGGVPVGGHRFTSPWATVRFVDGIDGQDGWGGAKPNRSFATIQAGVTASAEQDIVYVRPLAMVADASDVGKYAEQVTIAFAKHNLSLIGVKHGDDQNYGAKVRYATSGYVMEVYAAAFHLENFCIQKGGSITGAINLRGISGYATEAGSCGSTIENCMVRYGGIQVYGGYNTTIKNVVFMSAAGAVTLTGSAIPTRGHRIIGCDFMANNGAAVATAYLRILGSQMELFIRNCWFDQPTTADEYIYSTGSVDGLIADCSFADDDVTFGTTAADEIRIASGTMTVVRCYDNTGLIT